MRWWRSSGQIMVCKREDSVTCRRVSRSAVLGLVDGADGAAFAVEINQSCRISSFAYFFSVLGKKTRIETVPCGPRIAVNSMEWMGACFEVGRQ